METMDDDSPSSENTEQSTDQRLRQARVRNAIRQLTTEQQQVIALKFLEGWDNEEIALALGKPVGAVKSLQHRALSRLQKTLLDDEV
jgi:RNA polymerase sigma-70 factor (ECF subfamily)